MAPFDFGALRAPTLRANGIFPVVPNRDGSFRRPLARLTALRARAVRARPLSRKGSRMSRLAAALAVFLLVPSAARAQDDKKPDAELDAKTKAAIERAIEKAKEDVRNEVRAEIQGAQSAAEFLGAVAEGPKLEFFQVDGYYRFRGQLFKKLDLGGGRDASGRYLFPIPLDNPGGGRHTLATANMRLRM